MLTNQGKLIIKRFLARQEASIGNILSLGVSDTLEAVTNTSMGYELLRIPVTLTSYDFGMDQIVFKGTVPDDVQGVIYEVGLWTGVTDSGLEDNASRGFVSFDPDVEVWGDTAVFTSENARLGAQSLLVTPAAGGSANSSISDLQLDFMNSAGTDKFLLAYYNYNANCSSIKMRFYTDAANYYEYTITPPGTGFRVAAVNKSDAVVTGVPDWGDINSFALTTSAKAAGSAKVSYQGARIESSDDTNELVSRSVLNTPITKSPVNTQDFEYRLGVAL